MDSVFAISGKDFVIMAADTASARSIVKMKEFEDKILILDDYKLLGAAGDPADRVLFTEYIQKNLFLYELRTNTPLNTHAAANFTRGELATAIRRNPYYVNVLLGGYDKKSDTAELYFIDYLGTMHKTEFSAHGYCAYFLLSIMDRHYKEGLSVDDAVRILTMCVDELNRRFILNSPNFVFKIVDKNGARIFTPSERTQ